MTIGDLERLLGATARDVLMSIGAGPRGSAIRTQAAVVRTLIDQIRRHRATDPDVAFLRDQAKEELLRLMREVRTQAPLRAGAHGLRLRELE